MSTTKRNRAAFTLLEILLAVAIMGLVASVTFMTFSAATSAWRRALALSDHLHHGDFVMDQLVMALRSTYYPGTGRVNSDYGFLHVDDGNGDAARDEISWVKLGSALVGDDAQFVETPHRVRFFVTDDEDRDPAAAITAWRLLGQADDFEPDALDPVFLSKRIVGFDCRTAFESDDEGQIEWLDVWEASNRVPRVVSVTLYLEPIDTGQPPLALTRIVELPLGALAWNSR
jgi:prepilin-type N-terminal cleavage/methylation domain-containing protein